MNAANRLAMLRYIGDRKKRDLPSAYRVPEGSAFGARGELFANVRHCFGCGRAREPESTEKCCAACGRTYWRDIKGLGQKARARAAVYGNKKHVG